MKNPSFKSSIIGFAIALLIPFLYIDSQAQILNIEKVDTVKTKKDPLFVRISFSGDFSKRADNLLQIQNDSYISYRIQNTKLLLIDRIELIKSSGDNVISQGFVHGRTTFLDDKKFSPELFVQYQYDVVRGLDNRELAGAVGRIRLINKKKINISLSVGGMMEWEKWTVSDQVESARKFKTTISLQLNYQFAAVSLAATGYYQAAFNDFFHPRSIFDSVVSYDVSDNWSFGVSYNMLYDASPVLNVEPLIMNTGVELAYSF